MRESRPPADRSDAGRSEAEWREHEDLLAGRADEHAVD